MNESVKNQVDVVDFLLSMVEIGEFAILEFVPADGSEVRPFSQAAREPDGSWYLEVVSHHYLSRFLWPLDMRALRRLGWHPPATQEDNWWRYGEHCEGSDEVAWILVEGLRQGRRCVGEGEFQVTFGKFPPHPDGGLPVPRPETGTAKAA